MHVKGDTRLIEPARSGYVIHRAGKSLGEWSYRIIQRKTEGRASQQGDIHDVNQSKGIRYDVVQIDGGHFEVWSHSSS